MSDQTQTEDIGWAIVELMGHRRLGGYVSEQEIAGAAFLRIDVPGEPSEEPQAQPDATQFYSAGAVYCITPTTEEMARVASGRVEPVHRWELPVSRSEESEQDAEEYQDDEFPAGTF